MRFLRPVASSSIALAALLAVGCGARTELGVASTGAPDAGATTGACPDLPAPPTCADAGNPWLLFDYGSGGDGFAIYAVRADGSAFHKLALPAKFALLPAATPDGARILYVSMTSVVDPFVLHLYALATGIDVTLASGTNLGYAAMSPDGKTIAYVADNDVRLIDADGTNDRLLASTGYTRPAFRCDASTLFVTANGAILGALDASGHETTLIAGYGGYPDFGLSPDGSTVVTATICSSSGLDRELRTYPFDALPLPCDQGAPIPTTGLPLGALQSAVPTWSSAGLIAAVAGADTYLVPVMGGTARSVTAGHLDTTGAQGAGDPAWMPACAELP